MKVRGTRALLLTSKSLVPLFPFEFCFDSHPQGHSGFLMIKEIGSLIKWWEKKPKFKSRVRNCWRSDDIPHRLEMERRCKAQSFQGWRFQDISQPCMVLPAGMCVTSCSEQWGGCDTVVLPSKAAFSNLKLSCLGAKLLVFQKRRQGERERECTCTCVGGGGGAETDRDMHELRYQIYPRVNPLEQSDSVFVIRSSFLRRPQKSQPGSPSALMTG